MKKNANPKLIFSLTTIILLLTGVMILTFGKGLQINHRLGYIFLLSTLINVIVVTLLVQLVGRQQRKLGASEGRYGALFEHASDGIAVISSTDYALVEINHKFCQIMGCQPQELVGQDVRELLWGSINDGIPDAFRQFLEDSFAGESPENSGSRRHELKNVRQCPIKGVLRELTACPAPFVVNSEAPSSESEVTIRTTSGSHLPVSVSLSRLVTHQENLIILMIRDLSERKRHEAEREEIERRLFESSKLASLGELSAGVAHEINNPLNGIMAFAELLKEDRIARTDSQRKMLDAIIDEGGRIARIVRDLLTFARQSEHETTHVQVAETINTSISLFGHQLEKERIKVEIEVEPGLPLVEADGSRLRQVIVNMISNAHHALQAKPTDHKLFRITARAMNQAEGQVVRIEFFDNGIGISRENVSKLFDPFFTTRRNSGGTGLGLSLSFGIIRDYGGQITVDSEEGLYTCFTVELPVVSTREPAYAESFAG